MSDPYLYPHSEVLRNKFGLTDQKSLDRREADAVSVRSVLLQRNAVQGNFDSEHLKLIHEYLFRDVYDWAGQFRTVSLAKADYVSGGKITQFTPPELIESELAQVFEGLAAKHFLRGMLRKDFAREIAALLSEINRIDPFREGNGRAQRQFARQLSGGLGFKLHFEVVSKERLVQASILSANGDLAMMERLTDEITDTDRIQPLIKVISHLEQHHFNWNDHYVATTNPREEYVGTFAESDGVNFFFYDNQQRVLVGKLQDLDNQPAPGGKFEFTAS
jgi:cell filamentation protein